MTTSKFPLGLQAALVWFLCAACFGTLTGIFFGDMGVTGSLLGIVVAVLYYNDQKAKARRG